MMTIRGSMSMDAGAIAGNDQVGGMDEAKGDRKGEGSQREDPLKVAFRIRSRQPALNNSLSSIRGILLLVLLNGFPIAADLRLTLTGSILIKWKKVCTGKEALGIPETVHEPVIRAKPGKIVNRRTANQEPIHRIHFKVLNPSGKAGFGRSRTNGHTKQEKRSENLVQISDRSARKMGI